MICNHAKKLSLLIIALLATSPAHPMLVKHIKKDSSAHLYIKERKKKDLLIPRDESRDGFDHIITVGKVAVENAGTIVKSIETIAAVGMFGILTQVVTGKSLAQLLRERQERRGYDIDEPGPQQKREEEEEMNNRIQYVINMSSSHTYNPEKNKSTECFPEPKKEAPSTNCFPKPCETEVPSQGCFTKDAKNELPTGCFNENIQNEVQPRGCFDEIQLPKTPLTLHYEGQIRVGDVYFPEIPRREDGFKPAKEKGGKITKKVAPNGQYGYEDKKGNWWIPSGKNDRAHAGEHWDLIDKNGDPLDNIYPGGKIRSGEISRYTLWAEALPVQGIKTVSEKNYSMDFSGSELVHHPSSVTDEFVHRWEPNDNWTDKQREIYNKIEHARSLTRDDVKGFIPPGSLEEYYKHFGSTKYDSGVTLSPEAQELYDSPDLMDRLEKMSEDAGLLKDSQENTSEEFERKEEKPDLKKNLKKEDMPKEDKPVKENEEKLVKKEDKEKHAEEKKNVINRYQASLNYQHNKEIYGEDMGNYGNNYGYHYNPHTRQATYKQYNRNTIAAYESCIKYYSYLNCESIKNRE